MTITSETCRAARGLLGWSQDQLASAASVSAGTVRNFEAGRPTIPATVILLQQALETAGVIFIHPNGDGPGVRLKGESDV
jgi:transcriptional regulator with XRE-family HTH domain